MNINLGKIRPKYGFRNWPPFEIEQQLALSDCVEVVSHLKTEARISPKKSLFNQEKIKTLVKKTKSRKRCHTFISFLMLVFTYIIAILILTVISCHSFGNEYVAAYGGYIILALAIAGFILFGLFKVAEPLSRDPRIFQIDRNEDFVDFLSPYLSPQQEKALKQAIKKLIDDGTQLYEISNYKTLRKIPLLFWRAKNWFLLLSETEADRSEVLLMGNYPKGKIYFQKPIAPKKTQSQLTKQEDEAPVVKISKNIVPTPVQSNTKVEVTHDIILAVSDDLGDPWHALKKPYSKYLYSDKARLQEFVERMKKAKKTKFQVAWHEAVTLLLECHSEYLEYLNGNAERETFKKKFVAIFATISDDFSKEKPEGLKENDHFYKLGIKGVEKFLTGSNANIEKWIQENLT